MGKAWELIKEISGKGTKGSMVITFSENVGINVTKKDGK